MSPIAEGRNSGRKRVWCLPATVLRAQVSCNFPHSPSALLSSAMRGNSNNYFALNQAQAQQTLDFIHTLEFEIIAERGREHCPRMWTPIRLLIVTARHNRHCCWLRQWVSCSWCQWLRCDVTVSPGELEPRRRRLLPQSPRRPPLIPKTSYSSVWKETTYAPQTKPPIYLLTLLSPLALAVLAGLLTAQDQSMLNGRGAATIRTHNTAMIHERRVSVTRLKTSFATAREKYKDLGSLL